MGLGPDLFGVFHKLAQDGILGDVGFVLEFGAQSMECEGYEEAVKEICRVLGRKAPLESDLTKIVSEGSARGLYEAFGMEYACVDTNAEYGALTLDFNFDDVPEEHKNKYGLVTNLGTSEHLINQLNVFKMMHEFTRAEGLMLHSVPFQGYANHGLFNYNPNFFEALARFNSYEMFGMWVLPAPEAKVLIPWERNLMQYLPTPPGGECVIVVLMRKMYAQDFTVPFQGRYELNQSSEAMARYSYNVDGELINGSRHFYVTSKGSRLQQVPGRALFRELLRRIRIRIFGPG